MSVSGPWEGNASRWPDSNPKFNTNPPGKDARKPKFCRLLGSVYRLASGAEFSSQSFGLWAHGKGVKLDFNLASAQSSGIRAGLQWSQASEDLGLNPHFGDFPPGILVHAKDSVRRSVTFSAGSEKVVALQALGCRGSEELFFSIGRVELSGRTH